MTVNGSILGPEPTTQGLEAVIEMLKYLGKPTEPLTQAVHLSGMVLVLSSKKNAFYVTTPTACSCPSFIYRGGPCKHQKKYFARYMVRMPREEADAAEGTDSLIERGGFKPVFPDDETSVRASRKNQEA